MATALTEINSLGDNNTLARARHTEETGRFQTPWTPRLFSNLPQPYASIRSSVRAWELELGPSPHSPHQGRLVVAGGRALQEGLGKTKVIRRGETSGYKQEKASSPHTSGKQSCWKERCALVGSR